MTIEKGQPWGQSCIVPDDRVVVGSDHMLAQRNRRDLVSLVGGDLWKSLGSPALSVIGSLGTQLPIDAIVVSIDDSEQITAASSVEVGSWLSRSRYICIANTSFVGERNIAPRAHPNDGFLDYLEFEKSMPWRQRWVASRRAHTGTHIPHPHISTKRLKDIHITRQRSEALRIDGVTFADWVSIHVEIDPDHWQVIV